MSYLIRYDRGKHMYSYSDSEWGVHVPVHIEVYEVFVMVTTN